MYEINSFTVRGHVRENHSRMPRNVATGTRYERARGDELSRFPSMPPEARLSGAVRRGSQS